MRIRRAIRRSAEAMTETLDPNLAQLGWKSFFSDQVSAKESREHQAVRVISVHRGRVTILGEGYEGSIPSSVPGQTGPDDRPTVGDWLLIDREDQGIVRILDRVSLLKRPAPGDGRRVQLIAANIDTLFIVTSCDQDFNVARIERYLVLAQEAAVRPVVVLTKADLSPVPERFVDAARALQPGLQVELVDGRDPSSAAYLSSYCGVGETVALVGSSGVGKSTLIKTLTGSEDIATQAVREGDGKGRHTTTVREMHRIAAGAQHGGWLVDTPGMRGLQMSEMASGVDEVFDDITAMALECRFANCTHIDEPGCAINAAISERELDPARVERWRKLAHEDAVSSGARAARRSRAQKGGSRR